MLFLTRACHDHKRTPSSSHPAPSSSPRSLSALCKAWLGKELDKAEQCSDWDRRPLSPDQVKPSISLYIHI